MSNNVNDSLIDRLNTSLREVMSSGADIKEIRISKLKYEELYNDFCREFAKEYEMMGMEPSKSELKDYINEPIKIVEVDNDKEYEIIST